MPMAPRCPTAGGTSSAVFADDDAAPGLPKPQRTMTLDALLRRRTAPAPAPVPQSEADLLAALSALAAGGEH